MKFNLKSLQLLLPRTKSTSTQKVEYNTLSPFCVIRIPVGRLVACNGVIGSNPFSCEKQTSASWKVLSFLRGADLQNNIYNWSISIDKKQYNQGILPKSFQKKSQSISSVVLHKQLFQQPLKAFARQQLHSHWNGSIPNLMRWRILKSN